MRICWDNLVDSAVLSCFSENPNYPLANIQSWQLSNHFRPVGNSTETITFNLGSAKSVSRFAIIGHNLTASASITLQANTSNSWTTPAWSETVTRQSYAIIHRFTAVSYKYWRVVITDSGVTTPQISRVFLGTFLQLPGMKRDQELSFNTTAEVIISDNGQAYSLDGYRYDSHKINFPYLTNTQRLAIIEMFNTVQNTKPVLLTIWDDDETLEAPVYCILAQNKISFKRNENSVNYPWSTSLEIREVK